MILLDFRTTDEEQKDMSWTYTVYSNYIYYISNNWYIYIVGWERVASSTQKGGFNVEISSPGSKEQQSWLGRRCCDNGCRKVLMWRTGWGWGWDRHRGSKHMIQIHKMFPLKRREGKLNSRVTKFTNILRHPCKLINRTPWKLHHFCDLEKVVCFGLWKIPSSSRPTNLYPPWN